MESGIIVFYYTEGEYEAEAQRLEQSLRINLLPYFGQKIPKANSWECAVHMRAGFLLECLKNFPNQTILSLDADAFVHSNPWVALPEGRWDVACHTFVRPARAPELLPGTLAIRPTLATVGLLNEWQRQNKMFESWPDRYTFAKAVDCRRRGLNIVDLVPELCWIFDLSVRAYGHRQPIVEHLQASRSFKRNGNGGVLMRQREARIAQLTKKGLQ
jgi:hypothetical protein